MTDLLLEKQWDDWQKNNPASSFQHIDTEELKSRLINELSYVSKMSVEEYTLYQKWLEIQERYPTHSVNTLFGEETQLENLE